jgi:hypothetical protein
MSVVIPFRDPRPKSKLAARHAYRPGCRQLAAAAFAEAFNKSLKLPPIAQADIGDAISIFAAAMRRELKHLASDADIRSARR